MIDRTMRLIKDKILIILKPTFLFKIKPNTITSLSFLLGLVCSAFLVAGYLKSAFLFFVLNRITDGLDGLVARETVQQTDFGGYFDILTDFVIYALIPLAIAWRINTTTLWMGTSILLAVFYVNAASWMFLSALLEKPKYSVDSKGPTSLAMPRGLIEGTETIIFYSFMILLPPYQIFYITAMTVLTLASVPLRLRFARRILDQPEKKISDTDL